MLLAGGGATDGGIMFTGILTLWLGEVFTGLNPSVCLLPEVKKYTTIRTNNNAKNANILLSYIIFYNDAI
jgi:hypothetical protein